MASRIALNCRKRPALWDPRVVHVAFAESTLWNPRVADSCGGFVRRIRVVDSTGGFEKQPPNRPLVSLGGVRKAPSRNPSVAYSTPWGGFLQAPSRPPSFLGGARFGREPRHERTKGGRLDGPGCGSTGGARAGGSRAGPNGTRWMIRGRAGPGDPGGGRPAGESASLVNPWLTTWGRPSGQPSGQLG